MTQKLFDDDKFIDDAIDPHKIEDILNLLAFAMEPISKNKITNTLKYFGSQYSKPIIEKNIDYCDEHGLILKTKKKLNNTEESFVYSLPTEQTLERLFALCQNSFKYNSFMSCYKSSFDYYYGYGVSALRNAINSYFIGKYFVYTISENSNELDYLRVMFSDSRYYGFLGALANTLDGGLFRKYKKLVLDGIIKPDVNLLNTVFIENQLLMQDIREKNKADSEMFKNIMTLNFDESIEYKNEKSKIHNIALALKYQYQGNIENALKYYSKAYRISPQGINNVAITGYVIALHQANSADSLNKIDKLQASIRNNISETLPAKIVSDLIYNGSVKKNLTEYENLIKNYKINRFSELLCYTILKQLGETKLIDIQDDTFEIINNDPYSKLLKFEMSACFDCFKTERETMEKELGFKPLISCLCQRQEWEVLFDKLDNAIESSIAKQNSIVEQPQRIIYRVLPSTFELFPIKQKRLKSGKWGKPYSVDIYDFDKNYEGVDDIDRKVLDNRREYYNYDESPFSRKCYLELIGTDKVFRLTNEGNLIPIRIEKSEPSIIAKKTKDGIALSSDVNVEKVEDGVILKYEKNTETIKVISLTDSQLQIFNLLENKTVFPLEQEENLSNRLGKINENCKITLQSDLIQTNENIKKIEADSLITGVLQPIGDGLHLKLFAKPFVSNPPYCEPGKGTATIIGVIDEEQVQAVRNLELEKDNFNTIKKLLKENLYLDYTSYIETNGILDSLMLLELLQKNQDLIRTEWPEGYNFKLAGSADFKNLTIAVKSDNQWLDIEGELKVGEDLVIKMSELLEKVRESKERFIKLDDKTFLMLTNQLKKQLDALASMANIDRKKVKISAFEAFAMQGFEENGTEMQVDSFYKNLLKKIKDADKQTFDIPKGLRAELRDYQEDGYRWMMRLNSWGAGACLADDMGLGKTIQAIAVMLQKAEQGPSLVVCPASVLLNWRNEIEKFAPSLIPILIHSSDKQRTEKLESAADHDIVLITYGILISEAAKISEIQWNTIVLDEAHTIKNKETKMSKAAMNLKGDFKIILTGTPLQNHLGEIWNLFQFINPGLLGTFTHFTDNFITPIVKGEDKQRQKQLKNRLLPFMLRRTKNDVLDELPEKTEIVLDVELSDEETAIYENLRRIAIEKVSESENAGIQTLAEITRLRQAACNTQLVDKNLKITSSKAEMFMELVGELCNNNHRSLVFSQFTSHLALIIKRLEEENIKFLYLDGSTPIKEREKLVKTFQKSDDIPLFLISMKAGGLGLNLTAADYIIHLDPWWNPAVEDQASDRAYRIGQTRPVTVYRLISKNTIEEKIIRLHQTKKSLADALLDGSDVSHKLTKDEMLELLGVNVNKK